MLVVSEKYYARHFFDTCFRSDSQFPGPQGQRVVPGQVQIVQLWYLGYTLENARFLGISPAHAISSSNKQKRFPTQMRLPSVL